MTSSIEKDQQITLVNSQSWRGRVLMVSLVLAALLFGWFSVRWQIGNLVASLTSASDPNAGSIAAASRSLSPLDSSAYWLSAATKSELFTPEHQKEALVDYREAVRLSPDHYYWWLELGRAYEQADDAKDAEQAFKQAVELAPAYTVPRWQLGNFYLRQGRDPDAFKQLKKAAETDAVYREQVLSILWDYLDQDPSKLEAIVGDSPEIRVGLAKFYAVKEKPGLSLAKWRSVSKDTQEKNKAVGALIAQAFYDKRYLKAAVEFVRELGIEPDAKFESIENPGFEKDIRSRDPVYFGWKIQPVENARVLLSRAKKKSGKRSIQITFSGYDKPEFNDLYQTVALEPDATYELSYWIKTEDIRSAGTPKLEVLGAKDGKIIAASDPVGSGSADWQKVVIRFTVPKGSEGVVLRTARAYCGEKCPLFGTIWYDDFKIQRVSAEETDE